MPASVAPAHYPERQFYSDMLFSHFVTNHESFANGARFAPQFVAQLLREASSRPAMSLTGALLEFDAGTILIRYLSPSMEGASALRKESAARSLGTARNTGTALEQLVTLAAVAPVASENGSTAVAQPSGVDRGALLATVAQTLQELNYGALHAFENAGDQSLARQSALALESALNSPSAVATNLFATAAGAALKNSSGHAGWPPAAAERQEAKVGLGLALPLPQGASLP